MDASDHDFMESEGEKLKRENVFPKGNSLIPKNQRL